MNNPALRFITTAKGFRRFFFGGADPKNCLFTHIYFLKFAYKFGYDKFTECVALRQTASLIYLDLQKPHTLSKNKSKKKTTNIKSQEKESV